MFYLSGGTALAEFYCRHRYSDDLDFFTGDQPFPQLDIEAAVAGFKAGMHAGSVVYRKLYDRRIFFLRKGREELKLEFTYFPFTQIRPAKKRGGILVDSLEDIAANKFMALIDRIEAKDFVDLYFIISEGGLPLKKIAALAAKKFSIKMDALALGSELSKVRALTVLPKMIKKISLHELKDFFSNEAKQLKRAVLR